MLSCRRSPTFRSTAERVVKVGLGIFNPERYSMMLVAYLEAELCLSLTAERKATPQNIPDRTRSLCGVTPVRCGILRCANRDLRSISGLHGRQVLMGIWLREMPRCGGRLHCRRFEGLSSSRWNLTLVQLVETLRYKPEGRGFHFQLTKPFKPQLWTWNATSRRVAGSIFN
jgi:hypothetical protein